MTTRPLAIALAGVLAAAAGGCGGSDEKLPPPVTVAATTTPPATSTVATRTTAKRAPAHRADHRRASAASAKAKAAVAAQKRAAARERRALAEAKQVVPEIASNVKPHGSRAPVPCLRKAGLAAAGTRPGGGWQGRIGGSSQRLVFVDGPYRTDQEAQVSADSLAGINDVRAAGGYVVSAALAAKASAPVRKVADCLKD